MALIYIDLSATQRVPDPEVLQEQAPLLAAAGARFESPVSDAANKWRALDGIYNAPQKYLVLSALTVPARQAADLVDSTAAVARAITTFAEAVRTVRSARANLQTEITAAESDLLSRLSSEEDPLGTEFENTLFRYQSIFQERADTLAADYEQARAVCLTALTAVGRSANDVSSFYSSDTLDLLSHQAEALHRRALSPGASAEDVQRYYDYLGGMAPDDYRAFARDYPESAVYPPRAGLAADRQASFWQSLSTDQQEALTQALPAVVGNLEGVPYSIRAAANLTTLGLVMEPAWRATDAQRAAYQNIRAALQERDTKATQVMLTLIAFDPSEPPLAAVAIGNMDTATNITVNVSGMGSSTQDMEGAVSAANNIYTEQTNFTSRHAVLAWIGYNSPHNPPSTEVLFSDKARIGGARLASALDGVFYTRNTNIPSISVTAHSYGTTTAAYALSQTIHTVDAVVFYGSAGVDPEAASAASDLHALEVYAAQGSADFLAPVGIAGSNLGDPRVSPSAAAWGAKVFSADVPELGGTNGGHGMQGTRKHAGLLDNELGGGYLDYDTASLFQISAASAGGGSSLDLIPQSAADDRVDRVRDLAETAEDIYYAPGRSVDALQVAAAQTVDALQDGYNSAGDSVQDGLLFVSDRLQKHYLPDIGPLENPLNPYIDNVQRVAAEEAEAGRRQLNGVVDVSQFMVDRIVDSQQRAADDYFKTRWRMLEFTAGRIVETYRYR
ncbi:hypothetical protein ABIB35_003599 [Arthrobacter sp. UYP6]|uniref:alpha/beta hydrolase n=1 Tax=Arthrobacter sp. UYP6 TaxID=1756378 RepID=UPI003395E136